MVACPQTGTETANAMSCPACGSDRSPESGRCPACGTRSPASLTPGTRVAGRYEILGSIGSGGMGSVFKARDLSLEETVALKVLQAPRGDAVQRFRGEIKLAWRVRHPNVCALREYGEDADLFFISMEFVEGRDLRRLLGEHGALPWPQAWDVVLQVAEGLRAIHDAGVIHRDLKASNVMLDAAGRVRVMDFGIARSTMADGSLTRPGVVLGSPEYMSPEQIEGGTQDERSDLYSLGVLIFELFTGQVPFRGQSPFATMLQHLEDAPPLTGPEARRLPPSLIGILRGLLAKDPESRFRDCRQTIAALQAARAGDVPEAVPPSSDVGPQSVPAVASREDPDLPAEAGLLVPSLARALQHEDARVRAGAAQALGRSGLAARPAVPALLDARSDPSPEVRDAVRQALTALAPEETGLD